MLPAWFLVYFLRKGVINRVASDGVLLDYFVKVVKTGRAQCRNGNSGRRG